MIIRSKEELIYAHDLLNSSLYITFDVETTGLNVRKDEIIGFGLGRPDDLSKTIYIITKEFVNNELVETISDADILPIIEKLSKRKLIGFNLSYDSRITYHNYGIEVHPAIYSDEMLKTHTIDENRFNYQLKQIASDFFGQDSKNEQAAMLESIKANGGSDKEYYKADSTLMAIYGKQDINLTSRLFNYLNPILEKKGLTKFFYEDEVMPLYSNVTIPMELKGIPVDMQLLQQTKTEISLDINRIEAEIQEAIKSKLDLFNDWYFNRDEFKVKMSGQFLQTLAEHIAPSDWPKTDSGSHSFSEAAFKPKKKKGSIDLSHLLEHDLYAYYSGKKRVPENLATTVKQKMYASTGQLYAFNLQSKDHLKRLFFTKLQEEPLSKTPKGAPQVDDDFLELMATKYNWAAKLRTYNKLNKIKGTYVDRILDTQENGIFYPRYDQHKTTSGRFSGDLQQLPRVKSEEEQSDALVLKYNNLIRQFFISGAGKKLIDADYSSLEVVVFADDAQDQPLMDIITNSYDLYSQVAINVNNLGDEYSADKKAKNFLKKHKPELRQAAKAYSLGIRYGLGSFKLSKDLGIGQASADLIVKKYFESYPKLKSRMDELRDSALKNGYVKSKGGRIRSFPYLVEKYNKYGNTLLNSLDIWKEYHDDTKMYESIKKIGSQVRADINNAYNFPIQSYAASIVSRASVAIAKELKAQNMETYICMSTHDELCLLSPINEVDKAAKILQDKMENTTKLSVPLEAEPIIGERYSDVK